MVKQQITFAAENFVNVERCQVQVVTFHPVILRMSNNARVVSGIDAAPFVIDNSVERVFGGSSNHFVVVLRFR